MKGMSPLHTYSRHSPRKPAAQDGNENVHELGGVLSNAIAPNRAPLCPIPLPGQVSETSGNFTSTPKGKSDVATPRVKSRQSLQADSFDSSTHSTPEKNILPHSNGVIGRNRFGWHQNRHPAGYGQERDGTSAAFRSVSPTGRNVQECITDDVTDLQTPPRPWKNFSGPEVSHGNACTQSTNSNRTGHSNHSTPRSSKSVRPPFHDSEASGNGCGSQTGTPNRVSRSLKYSHQGANCGSSVSSALANNRSGPPGVRPTGLLLQSSRPLHFADYQAVEVPHFELEVDPSFWDDHNVQVLIRTRPLNASEISSNGYSRCLRQESPHTVTWIGHPECRFTFDHVACETITQEKLFKTTGVPMVDNCMLGYNSCMFAYGQTGSGKTHTMLGDIGDLEQRPSDNRGMTPRIFEYLFARISMEEESRRHENLKFICKCSFLEIYNEQITDLLEPSSTNLQMREDVKKGVYVENLREVEVRTVQDVVFLLLQGAANRRVAATNMNKESSRSHSVFTCVIESMWETDSMSNIRFGRLNLVDLAGSERQKSSGAEGERLKEAANINKSLSTLGLVIMILVDVAHGKQRHVPYRDSKLTFLLQDSLGGNSKTTIIANVSPSVCSAAETLSTLKFAQRAKFIQNNAIVNEDASGDVLALRLQIQQLKEELNRLRRQSISRIPLPIVTAVPEVSTIVISDSSKGLGSSSNESCDVENDNGATCRKIMTLEAVLAGSLRREQASDNAAKQLHKEIEQLNHLVRQREDDAQCSKMMLRFREDKIRRLESTLDGGMSAEVYRTEENQALKEEVQLLRGRIDRNPELTRFAMENIRLMDQLGRFQDFYGGGERETLLAEISSLRDQLLSCMDAEAATELAPQICAQILEEQDSDDRMAKTYDTEEKGIVSHLKCQLEEKEEMLQMQMSQCNELNSQLLEAVRGSETLQKELQESKEANRELVERLHLTEASLATAQEAAASAQATVKQIRLEMEDIAHQQRQSFSEIQEATAMWQLQELQLRSKLEEAQQLIQELSSQAPSESINAVTENPVIRRNENAERTLELQMEVDTLSHLLQEERIYRKDAEERSLTLSTQLDELEERELEVSKRLLESVENVHSQKSLVDSLEVQQSCLLSKIKELRDENIKMGEFLNKREKETQVLTGYVVYLQSELQRELELRVLEAENNEGQNSDLKVKLERTRKALRKAQHLNNKLQSEQDTLKACEHEKDLVRADAEMETTEAITLLQSEIQNLCEDQEITKQREAKSEHKAMQLATDLRNLQVRFEEIVEENTRLSELYEDVVKQKDSEILNLRQVWNQAATSLIECLAEGNQALDDAAQEIENIAEDCTSPSRAKLALEEGTYNRKEGLVEVLQGRLLHAQKLAKQTENKVRVLSDATLAIAQIQRQEKATMQADLESLTLVVEEKCSHINQLLREVKHWKLRVIEAEKMALAALVVVNKFSSRSNGHVEVTDLSRTEDRLVMLVEIQLLQDLLNLQGKLTEEELSRSSSMLENKIQEHASEIEKEKGSFETAIADLQKQVTEVGEKFLLEARAAEMLQRNLCSMQTKLSSAELDLETVSAEFERQKNEWDSEKSNLLIGKEWLDSRLAEKDRENLYLHASVETLIALFDTLQEMDARMIDKSSVLSQQMLVGLQIENSYMNEEITEIEKHLQDRFCMEKQLELTLCSLQETCAQQHSKLGELQHLAEELDISQKTISQLETDKLNMMDAIMNEKTIICHLSHQIAEQDANAAVMRSRHTEMQLDCLRLGEKVDDLSKKLAKSQTDKEELEVALQKERLLAVQLQEEVELASKQVESLVSEREQLVLDLTGKSLLLQEESEHAQTLCVKMNNMESNSRALLHELDKQRDYVQQIQLQHEDECTRFFSCINAAAEQFSGDAFLVLVDAELRRNISAHEVCSLKSEVASLREKVNQEGEDVVKRTELERTVNELQTSVQQLKRELQLTHENSKVSHIDMELSEQKCAELLSDLERVRGEFAQQKFMGIVDIEIEKAVLNSQIQHLENTLLSNESTLDIFKDKLYQISKESASLKMENVAQEDMILQLQRNLDSCSRELECCQMEVKDAEQRSVVALTKLRDVTNEMERENLTVFASMESLKNELESLRVQNSGQQEVIEQLKQESLDGETHFRGIESRAKQAEERCVYLSKTLEDVTETSKAETYVNVFESEILKGVLSNQVLVIEKDLFLVNQRSQEMKEQIMENNKLISCLKSENCNLNSQVEALLVGNQKDRKILQLLGRDLELCREEIAHLNMENKDLVEGLNEQTILTEQLREELHQNCTAISKIRSSHHQEVEKFLKIIASFRDDVQDSCEKIRQLDLERDNNLACQGKFFKKVMMELEACENEIKEMESNQRFVNRQLQENTELLWNAQRELKKASSTVSELKIEQYLLLEMIEKQVHISSFYAGSQEYLEKLMVIEDIHASCSHNIAEREVKFQNALLKLADKDEELRTKESALYLLRSELVCASQREKTLDEKGRNLEHRLEWLFEQQEKQLNLVSVLQQEKQALEKELQMKIEFTRSELEQKTVESFLIQEIFASQFQQVAAKVEKLERENVALMAEADQKQEDMEILRHELVRSCDFVAEVKDAHLKTLQELHNKEKEVTCLYSKVNIKEYQIEHERAQLACAYQALYELHEDALLLVQGFQENCRILLTTVGSHEIQLSDLYNRILAFLPAKEPKEFFLTADACNVLFSEIESITESFCMISEDHESAAISFRHTKLALEEKEMQVLVLSTRITELEEELQCIQKEKARCELTVQKHEDLKARDALQVTHEGPQELIQAVQGHEMKLAGLQMKIEMITEQMTQEIGQDSKIAFMEGCELVLSEVEKEVRTCREHADLAWKKFEEVLEEKRKAESELQRKDQVLRKLQMEVNLSQEFCGHVGPGESAFNMEQHCTDLGDYRLQITSLKSRISELQNTVDKVNEELLMVGTTASDLRQRVLFLEAENEELKVQVKELDEQKVSMEDELEDKGLAVEALEAELLELNCLVEEKLANSLGSSNENLAVVIKERDKLHAELVVLNEQLEMAQQLAEEHEAVAIEARQVAETSKTYAEQKEEEAKLLERSVEELESTVNALETQVGMIKNDADRQRLMRENMEIELQVLRHQMLQMQALKSEEEIQYSVWEQKQREHEIKETQAEQRIQMLEKKLIEKDEQIKNCRNHTVELIAAAERQASEYHQQLRALEGIIEQVKGEHKPTMNIQTSKISEKGVVKSKGTGSPFKCIGSGLTHQINLELDEELAIKTQKIEELEAFALSRQKEIFMLNARLAEAESMTHDVIRELLGVKLDITNYASLANHQQVQKIAERAQLRTAEAEEKARELEELKEQLHEFIEERESWLEEINRRQAEMMTARVAAEKLRQRDQIISTENEVLKAENATQKRRLLELEDEVNKLSGQQNLQQRIHHHAKIKEENNCLRIKNEDLAAKLRRTEVLLNRVSDELGRYRAADGKTPHIDFEEEQKLKLRLQEVEEEKIQVGQKLLMLCTSLLKVAGIVRPAKEVDHAVAADALKYIQDRLESTERELSDVKLKNKIDWEKHRLSELRSVHSPKCGSNVVSTQKSGSPSCAS